MENLREIVKALQITCEETGLKIFDETIFEQAVKIYLTREIGQSKLKPTSGEKEEKPTEKQIKFLKSKGWQGPLPKTKKEAMDAIGEYIQKHPNDEI